MAYSTTEVAVERSQGEVRKLLYTHGATNFSFSEGFSAGAHWASVEFVHNDHLVRVRVPLKVLDLKKVKAKADRSRTKTSSQIAHEMVEQEARRIWRVLVHGLKARLVSVEEGVETFEQAFLSHLVDPNTNQTLWEATRGLIESGVLRLGGAGIEFRPPSLESVRGLGTGRDRITADDSCHDDVEVVDAEVVG